jgi:rhodanese-related sulfurtransferase
MILVGFALITYADEKTKLNQEKLEKVYAMYEEYKKEFKNISTLTTEEIKNSKTEIILVDIRSEAEQKVSMIPGAITKEDFEKNKDKYKNTLIVPYCTIGVRSGYYAEKLSKDGFNTKNYKGSILAWVLSGGVVLKDKKEVLEVHVYGEKWNLLPSQYKGIW